MKNILLACMLLVPLSVMAQDDQSIMFEIGIGFGNSSGGRTDGNNKAKFCKNRNTDRMIMGAIRYSYNDVEAHVARWFHDEDTRCNRDSWAVGVGYVLDTQGDGKSGTDGAYVSWTPGLAYTWGDDKGFTGQDETNTNWRQTGNFQIFNRLAVGAGGNDGAVEVAVHRYGTFNPEHGENFITIGGALRALDGGAGQGAGGTDEQIDTGPTTINNTTIINIIDGNTGPGGDNVVNTQAGGGDSGLPL